MLSKGEKPPKEFTRAEVAEILMDFYMSKWIGHFLNKELDCWKIYKTSVQGVFFIDYFL
jgi:ATP sulfurylase